MDPEAEKNSSSEVKDNTATPKSKRGHSTKGVTTGTNVSEDAMTSEESGRAKKRRLEGRVLAPTITAVQLAKNAGEIRKFQVLKRLREKPRYQEASKEVRKQMEAVTVKNVESPNVEGQSSKEKQLANIQDVVADVGANNGSTNDEESGALEKNTAEDEHDVVKEVKKSKKKETKLEKEKEFQEMIAAAMEVRRRAQYTSSPEGLRNMLVRNFEHAAAKYTATGERKHEKEAKRCLEELEEYDKNPNGPLI